MPGYTWAHLGIKTAEPRRPRLDSDARFLLEDDYLPKYLAPVVSLHDRQCDSIKASQA
jgi:hypothetical protein